MQQTNRSSTIAAAVAIVLMLGAITWGAWNARLVSELKIERDAEKQKVETLLFEKVQVEKNLAGLESQLKRINRENETLQRQIAEAHNLNDVKSDEIKQLQKKLASNRKSYAELTALNTEMENRLSSLNQQIAQLQEDRLAANRETETLRGQIDNLKRELAMAHSAYYDKVFVETMRGKKDKLVVKASRTKKLRASVMIPAALKDVKFQVFDPQGKLISSSPDDGTLAVRITDDINAVASMSDDNSSQSFKQAEMIFLPKHKLASGTYRVDVLSENISIGSFQLRLR